MKEKIKFKKKRIGSLRCKVCNQELPEYDWDDQYCEDCLVEFNKMYIEELEDLFKEREVQYP